MHRLRKGKKEKDEGEKESGVGGFLSGRSFKKGKNVPEPIAPALDLASALPPTDDFRTSLLMPNLAQRFSILVSEQPDSQPKPASNGTSGNDLGSFNFSSNFSAGGLSDIAETSSISGSIVGKAGTANAQSRDSHTSDESAGGGIMNRARPGEGNVLFGGRQKIFRVAANSTRGSSEDTREPGSMGGRVYYDNDVPVSTFAWREKKKTYDDYDDEKENEEIQELQNQRSSSPSQQGNSNNRNTSSSTNSTPLTRSSTAATSINSQHPSGPIGSPPNTMVTGKPRRQPLYEQALDQKIQEQSKLELFTNQLRRGAMSPTTMSGHSPIDGYQAQRSGASSPIAERNQFYDNSHNKPAPIATPVGGLSTFNFGLDAKSGDDANEGVGGYDDERYHLMQKQKLLRDDSPPRGVESPVQEGSKDHVSVKRSSVSSAGSDGPGRLDWSKLDMSSHSSHASDFKPADKRQSGTHSHQAFLSASSDESSDYEYDVRDGSFEQVMVGGPGLGLGLQNPQGKKAVASSMNYEDVSRPSTSGSGRHSIASTIDQKTVGRGAYQSDGQPLAISNGNRPLSPISPHLTAKNEDSPTLPPVQGLSVLVRQHLRTDSGRSSIYAGSTYTTHSRISRQNLPDRVSITGGFKFGTNGIGKAGPASDPARPSGASGSSGGNLWEYDDWDGGYYGEDHGEPDSLTSGTHPAFRKHSVESIESTETREDVIEDKGFDYGRDGKQDDEWLRGKEQISDGSGNRTSDEGEDRDWEDELAHRKKLVQQNLREHESRSNSPVPGFASDSRPTSPGPLNILGRKTSNGMLNSEGGSKTMRKFGVGGDKHRDLREEEERLRETVRGAKNLPMHNGYRPHPQDRDFRQGPPPLHMHPNQRRPPHMVPNGDSRPPPHLDEHPAMRGHPPPNFQGRGPPSHGPPYGAPYGPPVASRLPMRGPSLRGQPSREGFRDREGGNSPRIMSPPRNGDPRWRDDHQFDGHHGVPGLMPHSTNPSMPASHGTPRMGGALRMGGSHGDSHWDGPMDRRPSVSMGPSMGRPMNGPRYPQDGGPPMGRGPQGGYPDDPRMLHRGPSQKMRSLNDMRDRNYDMGRRQGPYSPEQSPPPSQMRPRGNGNAQSSPYNSPPLNRQRSESAVRRDGPTLPLLQTSPPRNSRALNGSLDQSPPVGRSPAPMSASTPALQLVSTPLSPSGKSIGFPSTPNPAASSSPALPSTRASAGPAAAAYAKMQNFQQSVGPTAKKRIVDKTKISEPKLIASTSNISTVPLPPQSPTPPLSAPGGSVAQSKRRQTTTIFGGFGKNNSAEKMPSDGELEKSSFQLDEPKKERPRGKLRKSMSDGGGLGARARKEADKNAPATPSIPQAARGMF